MTLIKQNKLPPHQFDLMMTFPNTKLLIATRPYESLQHASSNTRKISYSLPFLKQLLFQPSWLDVTNKLALTFINCFILTNTDFSLKRT